MKNRLDLITSPAKETKKRAQKSAKKTRSPRQTVAAGKAQSAPAPAWYAAWKDQALAGKNSFPVSAALPQGWLKEFFSKAEPALSGPSPPSARSQKNPLTIAFGVCML